jgi:hypothetical protein
MELHGTPMHNLLLILGVFWSSISFAYHPDPLACVYGGSAVTSCTGSGGSLVRSSGPAITDGWTLTDSGDIVNASDATKELDFSLSGMTTGKILTLSSSQSTSETLNIPNITSTDTLATLGLSQTFSGTNTFSGSGTAVIVNNFETIGSSSTEGVLNIGDGTSNADRRLRFEDLQASPSTLNYQIAVNHLVAGSLEWDYSTTNGGSTYATGISMNGSGVFNIPGLGASLPVFTDSSKNLITPSIATARTNLGIQNYSTFITSGVSWSIPASSTGFSTSTACTITLIGPGGGSAGVAATANLKSAGSGGGAVCQILGMTGFTPGGSETVAIGAGGANGAAGANNGSSGGNTTITIGATTYTAGGGAGSTTGASQTGGAGGTTTNCTGAGLISFPGQPGAGTGAANANLLTSPGGNSGLGWGQGGTGNQNASAAAGVAGTGYGAGASGAVAGGTGTAEAGASGLPGAILIQCAG